MPLVSYHNRFTVLPKCSLNETVEPSIDVQNPISKNPVVTPTEIVCVTGVTSLHLRSVLGRDSNKELSLIQAKGTSKGCEQSVVD